MAVSVTTADRGADALEITLPADTQAFIDTPIYARTNGYLRHWYADIGAHVHQGQVLAEIQTPELDQQVEQAQSDLLTAEANQNIAQITEDRWKKLLAKNAVSKQEADQALSDLSAKTSTLASAQANVRRLQQIQGFEKVYAPFDGVITARNIDVGSLIQAGDSGSLKAELFHMAATDKLRLFVPVPEVYAGNVGDGERVAVTSDATPQFGRNRHLEPHAERGSRREQRRPQVEARAVRLCPSSPSSVGRVDDAAFECTAVPVRRFAGRRCEEQPGTAGGGEDRP